MRISNGSRSLAGRPRTPTSAGRPPNSGTACHCFLKGVARQLELPTVASQRLARSLAIFKNHEHLDFLVITVTFCTAALRLFAGFS